MSDLRVYDPAVDDFAASGYPVAWDWVKHQVRERAGHRCIRCGHPYVVGQSGVMDAPTPDLRAMMEEHEVPQSSLDLAMELVAEDEGLLVDPTLVRMAKRQHWSPCDDRCDHGAPIRYRLIGTREWGQLSAEDDQYSHQSIGLRTADSSRPGDGLPGQYEIQAAWRILTVHHLNGVKADCRWWNLAALCQRCHLTIQGKVVMDRVWPWPHSTWFEPYAAGWYAAAYLGEDISREEADDRLQELLALERMA